jgi:hypothetical protein
MLTSRLVVRAMGWIIKSILSFSQLALQPSKIGILPYKQFASVLH